MNPVDVVELLIKFTESLAQTLLLLEITATGEGNTVTF